MTATVPHVTPAVTATWNSKQRAEVNTVIGHPFSSSRPIIGMAFNPKIL